MTPHPLPGGIRELQEQNLLPRGRSALPRLGVPAEGPGPPGPRSSLLCGTAQPCPLRQVYSSPLFPLSFSYSSETRGYHVCPAQLLPGHLTWTSPCSHMLRPSSAVGCVSPWTYCFITGCPLFGS